MPRKKKIAETEVKNEEIVQVNIPTEELLENKPVSVSDKKVDSVTEPVKKKGRPKKTVIPDKAEDKPFSNADSADTKKKKDTRKKQPAPADGSMESRTRLKGAKTSMTILSGMIERVETEDIITDPDLNIMAVVLYNGFKVIIPAGQMGLTVAEDMSKQEKIATYKKYLSAMIGANIDYVILKVSEQDKLAVGSRKIAMAIKRKQNFFNKYRNTGRTFMEFAKDKKLPVDACVVAVSGSVVRVDVGGVECKVYSKDASWRYISNLLDRFTHGDKFKVIVKTITIKGENDVEVTVSIRDATPNKQIQNARQFRSNSTCIGKITGITEKGFYISLGEFETGIDAFCNLVHGQVVPSVGDTVICQLVKVDYERGFALAKINRILRKS